MNHTPAELRRMLDRLMTSKGHDEEKDAIDLVLSTIANDLPEEKPKPRKRKQVRR